MMTVIYTKNRSQATRLSKAIKETTTYAVVKRIIRVGDRFQVITGAPLAVVEHVATVTGIELI